MQLHAKKKVEIIVEASLLEDALALIEKLGARGYTVLPARAGRGVDGAWETGNISGAFQMVMVVVIADATIAERIVEQAFTLLEQYTAIVYVSDVEVVRGEQF